MANCYICLHYEACCDAGDQGFSYLKDGLSACKHFKDKFDVVEVVRCKDCKHGDVSIISRTKDGKETWGCYCNVKNKVTDVDAYCSCGKKRGNENGNKQ